MFDGFPLYASPSLSLLVSVTFSHSLSRFPVPTLPPRHFLYPFVHLTTPTQDILQMYVYNIGFKVKTVNKVLTDFIGLSTMYQ